MSGYRIAPATATSLAEAAEGALQKPGGLTFEDLETYLASRERTAERVVIAATQLKILYEEDGKYKVTKDGIDLAKATPEQRPVVFKKLLVRYDPFIMFATLILKGNTIEDAARKVKVIYNFREEETTILQSLKSWGVYSEALHKTKDGFTVGLRNEIELTAQYVRDLVIAVQNEYNARMFISAKMREDAFVYLGDEEKVQLADALLLFDKDPEKAVFLLGKSFETFLRKIGADNNVTGIQGAKGIGQLANRLKGENVVTEPQNKLSEAVSVIRNATDHGTDPTHDQYWKIEGDTAFEAILLSLTTMRSIVAFAQKGDLIL